MLKRLTVALLLAASPVSPAWAEGADVYADYCAACHMPDGSGMSGLAPGLKSDLWRQLGEGAPTYFSAVVLNGMAGVPLDGERFANAMPPWDTLDDAELAALANYVLGELNGIAQEVAPETIAQIRGAALSIADIRAMRDGG